MPRANPKLSADERAFLNRLDCLNEEEIKQLTTRELFAYFKVIDKVDSRADARLIVKTREVNRRLRNGEQTRHQDNGACACASGYCVRFARGMAAALTNRALSLLSLPITVVAGRSRVRLRPLIWDPNLGKWNDAGHC